MNNRLVGRFKIRGGEKCREAVVDNQEGKEGGLDQLGEKRREVEGLEGRRKRTDRPGDGRTEGTVAAERRVWAIHLPPRFAGWGWEVEVPLLSSGMLRSKRSLENRNRVEGVALEV